MRTVSPVTPSEWPNRFCAVSEPRITTEARPSMCSSLIGSPSETSRFRTAKYSGVMPKICGEVFSPPKETTPFPCSAGATASIEGAANWSLIACASPSVNGLGLRMLSPRSPRKTNKRFVPIPLMEPVMDSCAPVPTASMAITAATPMTMPSTVRPERSLLPLILSSASIKACQNVMRHSPVIHPAAGSRAGFAQRWSGRA